MSRLSLRKLNVEVVLFRVMGSRWFKMVQDGSRWFKMVQVPGYFKLFSGVLKASSGAPCVPMPECIRCEPRQENFALVALVVCQ